MCSTVETDFQMISFPHTWWKWLKRLVKLWYVCYSHFPGKNLNYLQVLKMDVVWHVGILCQIYFKEFFSSDLLKHNTRDFFMCRGNCLVEMGKAMSRNERSFESKF